MDSMASIRKEIDSINARLAKLIKSRQSLVKKIFDLKASQNLPLKDPLREKEQLDSLDDEVKDIFRKIFEVSIRNAKGKSKAD